MAITDEILIKLGSDYDLTVLSKHELMPLEGQLIHEELEKFYVSYPNLSIIDVVHDSISGLDAIVVKDCESLEVAIIFQGSHDPIDWFETNLSMAANEVPLQYLAAIEYTHTLMQTETVVAVAGNSLGGGNAQVAVLATPTIRGVTLNPSGMNQATLDYLHEHFGVQEELHITNLYTKTDILSRLMGIQTADGISKEAILLYLKQQGEHILLSHTGDFSFESMPSEHMGSDLLLQSSLFDALNSEILRTNIHRTVDGIYQYVGIGKRIDLDVEAVLQLSTKMQGVFTYHAQAIKKELAALQMILQQSAGNLDARQTCLIEAIDEAVYNLIGKEMPVVQMLYDERIFSYIIWGSQFTQIVSPTLGKIGVVFGQYLKNKYAIRTKIVSAIQRFFDACQIDYQNYDNLKQNTRMHYPEYLNAKMEEALQHYLVKLHDDMNKTLEAMQYYQEIIEQTTLSFQQHDEMLASNFFKEGLDLSVRLTQEPLLELNYDAYSFRYGLNQTRQKLMHENLGIFAELINELILLLRDDVVSPLLFQLRLHHQYLQRQTTLPFSNWLQKILKSPTIMDYTSSYYQQLYEADCKYLSKEVMKIGNVLTPLERIFTVLNGLGSESGQLLVQQFQESILQMLFYNTALYDIFAISQRLCAHTSTSAQVLAEVNGKLANNTSLSVDQMHRVGLKVQKMLEIAMTHYERIRS